MPTLRIKTLSCYETEDEFGPDEAYLKVNGETVWGPVTVKAADDITIDQEVTFTGEATVELWDKDRYSADDLLGSHAVSEDLTGEGDQEARFTYDRSHYKLTYEVM